MFDPGNAIAIQALVNSIELVNSGDIQIKICESLSRIDPNYNIAAIDTLVNIIQARKTESLTCKAAFTLGKLSIQLSETDNNSIFALTIKTLVQIIESGQDRANQIVALDNLRQIDSTHPATHQEFISDRSFPSSTRNQRKKAAHHRNIGVAISELEQKLSARNNSESQRRYAYQLGKFQPGHPMAVDALLQLMSSPQLPSFYKRTGEYLKEVILEAQLPLVIKTLNHKIGDLELDDASEEKPNQRATSVECYKLLWYCAEQLPYHKFIDIWG